MKSVRFKCPECNQIVKIEGTDVKVCPICGWSDIKIRKEWSRNPRTQVRKNKSKRFSKLKDIIERLKGNG